MNAIASRYAAALLTLTAEEALFAQTAALLTGTPPLWEALTSPAIPPREKQAVLRRLPQLRAQPVLLHFYLLLCDKGRMALLPEIVGAYQNQVLAARGGSRCVMTCVHVPDEAQQTQIKTMLSQLHHRSEIQLDIRQDPALLGGFTLEIDGVTYDKSVRGRLDGLRRHLQERRMI